MNHLYIGLLKNNFLGLFEVIKTPKNLNNYHRVEMGPGDWKLLENDYVTNAVPVEFSEALESWGIITHFGIFDSLIDGKLIAFGELKEHKTVSKHDRVQFEIDSTNISLVSLGVYNG